MIFLCQNKKLKSLRNLSEVNLNVEKIIIIILKIYKMMKKKITGLYNYTKGWICFLSFGIVFWRLQVTTDVGFDYQEVSNLFYIMN